MRSNLTTGQWRSQSLGSKRTRKEGSPVTGVKASGKLYEFQPRFAVKRIKRNCSDPQTPNRFAPTLKSWPPYRECICKATWVQMSLLTTNTTQSKSTADQGTRPTCVLYVYLTTARGQAVHLSAFIVYCGCPTLCFVYEKGNTSTTPM